MLAYASTVFAQAQLASNSSVYMAMFQLLVTLVAVAFEDRSGRRFLLFVGCSSMAFGVTILVLCFGVFENTFYVPCSCSLVAFS